VWKQASSGEREVPDFIEAGTTQDDAPFTPIPGCRSAVRGADGPYMIVEFFALSVQRFREGKGPCSGAFVGHEV